MKKSEEIVNQGLSSVAPGVKERLEKVDSLQAQVDELNYIMNRIDKRRHELDEEIPSVKELNAKSTQVLDMLFAQILDGNQQ